MTLAPLVQAGPLIAAHASVALAALALGLVQLVRPKGTISHKLLGWTWVLLMLFIAIGSFGIHTIRQFGPFSLIHVLSAFSIIMVILGVMHARAGRIKAHSITMICLFVFALVITGLFTLVPGRVMHAVVFGPS